MKLSMMINYSGDFHADVQKVVDLEKAGLDVVWVPEVAAVPLGVLADRRPRRNGREGRVHEDAETALVPPGGHHESGVSRVRVSSGSRSASDCGVARGDT